MGKAVKNSVRSEKVWNMEKTVIFDMDGVIFDTEVLILKCWNQIGEKNGIKDIDIVCRKCIGTNLAETRKIVLQHYGQDFPYDVFREQTSALFREKTKERGIPVKRGARELLSYFKVNGFQIGLASSTRKAVLEEELSQAGLLKFFHVLIGGDMVTHSKPHPEIYIRACEELGTRPSDTYAIEDSFNGVRSAHSAGMRVIMVPDIVQPDDEMREKSVEIFPTLMGVLGYFQNL